MIRTIVAFTALAVAAALSLIATPAHTDTGCPSAVIRALTAVFADAAFGACKAEYDHRQDAFEVAVTRRSGTRLSVDVAADGAILEIEEQIAIDALPAAVKQAFAARYPRVGAQAVEKQTAGRSVRYEVVFQVDRARREATFAENGSFIEEE